MSDAPDKESKTENATEKKISDAIEKGNVPHSREAPMFASLAGILLVLVFLIGDRAVALADRLALLLDKPGDFVGKAACAALKAQPLARKLCCMTLDDPKAVLFGYEPIFGTNGHTSDHAVGYVTSANYGYSVGKFIAYGYLPADQAAPGTPVEIEYFGDRFKAVVAEEPLFDAKMTRLKQ